MAHRYVVLVVLGLVGCSSEPEAATPPKCVIEGTYSTSFVEYLGSYNCDRSGDVTYSVTPSADGYQARQDGTGLTCTLRPIRETAETLSECRYKAERCVFDVTIPTTPPDERAFVEYDWTFSTTGFTGQNFVFVPRTPAACSGHVRVEGRRL